jgi:hypothetical protein
LDIVLRPGIDFKSVEENGLIAQGHLGQGRADHAIKCILVDPEVGRGIAKSDKAGLDLHALSAYVNSSYLGSDMAQLGTDGQPGPLIGLSLCRG